MTEKPDRFIQRSAKGKRPQYFQDPASDKLHFMVMALVEELSVTRDRLDAVERILERKGVSTRSEVDGFAPTEEDERQRTHKRKAYVNKIMKCFADEKAQMELSDKTLDFEDVVKVVSE